MQYSPPLRPQAQLNSSYDDENKFTSLISESFNKVNS